ncbi:redox-active protein [Desulfovibrio desulfuricans]|uniref:Redox-active protein n=1 Tax=Desulfovibrio desulfuricans TaxID=876 RepID=A0A4V1CXM5_DESDE|nr:C-GCAxxG-C-C family (seleno)protein [Desulfovibrio desulfuricans]QCC86740.1 redox-active protein [Desulfovibrio desulfuricans]
MNTHDRMAALVRHYYWDRDLNCARTTLRCLESMLQEPLHPQVYAAAVGCHGAGGTGGQCGLMEGGLLLIGLRGAELGKDEGDIVDLCARYAALFTERFSSLACKDLRPGGIHPNDPPHLCESISVDAICLLHDFLDAMALSAEPNRRISASEAGGGE